ncbi:MAG: SGNH/GDSL hydrolase family protein [Thermoleophilaceae bacterium]
MGYLGLRRLGILTALIVLCGGATARADGGVYVSLGDSYTSGPLIPNQHGEPIGCGRSDHNYPSLVAGAFTVATFVDVSCGSAETKHMTEPQTGLPAGGTNPPQFNGLRADATLVTVGIGGNDAGLVGVGEKCAQLGATNPTGHACRDYWAPGGNDSVTAKIAETAPKIAAVLQGIHQRSPSARVAIVGYPDPLPKNGESCWPMVPLSPDDVRYIDELIIRINAMIKGQAELNGAQYIDTYTDSIGHDVCKLPPNRWFEGVVPTEPAYPLHPNANGEASMARSVIAQLGGNPAVVPTGNAGGQIEGRRGAQCLAAHPRVGRRGVGRVRVGLTRRALARRVKVAPARRSRLAWIWCTRGGTGRVAAVFSKRLSRARVEMILTTAPAKAFRQRYPHRRSLGPGLSRSSPRSNRLLYKRHGRVLFVAVMRKSLFHQPKQLGRDFRLALR